MRIINLTPHSIVFINDEGKKFSTISSSGIARVNSTTNIVGCCGHVPITETTFGQVEGLPEEKPEVRYIVSRMVATAAKTENPKRNDLLVPGLQVRDNEGKIIGCKSLDRA